VVSSRDFVYEKFSSYYKQPSVKLPIPASFSQREFAALLFKERAMVRHKHFVTPIHLGNFIKERIPSDVYYSCAYYETPDAEMEKKGWSGADLVFDIDADHIPTPCNKIHDEFTCSNSNCGFAGRGITPSSCPICGGVKFEVKTWACDECIDTTRNETRKLLDMLTKDFGFSEHEIHTFFSGHRGYHIHVENEAARSIDAVARKEIVDYVCGIGLALFDKDHKEPANKRKKRGSTKVFSLNDYGWKRRLRQGMREFISSASLENLIDAGLIKKTATVIYDNKEIIMKRCLEENLWGSVRGVGMESWTKLAEYAKNLQAAQIDTVVTSDVHRLIRAENTLHGKTGLLKKEFPVKDLDIFDPFRGAVAFNEGKVRVLVSSAPEFRMSEQTYGPYKNQTVELSTAAAILLILKGRAEVLI
jgi:DNA primase small subunit